MFRKKIFQYIIRTVGFIFILIGILILINPIYLGITGFSIIENVKSESSGIVGFWLIVAGWSIIEFTRKKKAQAAMEFLMTYGWAIMATILAIGILAYFGVFGGKSLGTSTSAILSAPFSVNAVALSVIGDSISIEIRNSGIPKVIQSILITGCGVYSTQTSIGDGGVVSIAIPCSPQINGRIKGDIVVTWTNVGSSLNQISKGTINGYVDSSSQSSQQGQGGGEVTCGDGLIGAGETCDDANEIPLDGCDESCQVESGWSCNGEPSACSPNPPVCGNGVKETGEDCDGADFGAETCITQGFAGGTIACSGACTYDTSHCTNVPTDYVAYWNFNEVSGTTAADSSGNGNTGTLTGGATWVAGQIGNAVSFDGVDDYVNVPNSASTDFAMTSFSVAFWVYPTNNAYTTIFDKEGWEGSLGRNSGWRCVRQSPLYNVLCTFAGTSSVNVASANNVLLINQWNHVVVVVDRTSNAQIYINGVASGSPRDVSSIGSISHTGSLKLGTGASGSPNLGSYFGGRLDEFKIYNRVLTASEVTFLAS